MTPGWKVVSPGSEAIVSEDVLDSHQIGAYLSAGGFAVSTRRCPDETRN
jgi:hypothetical protein